MLLTLLTNAFLERICFCIEFNNIFMLLTMRILMQNFEKKCFCLTLIFLLKTIIKLIATDTLFYKPGDDFFISRKHNILKASRERKKTLSGNKIRAKQQAINKIPVRSFWSVINNSKPLYTEQQKISMAK